MAFQSSQFFATDDKDPTICRLYKSKAKKTPSLGASLAPSHLTNPLSPPPHQPPPDASWNGAPVGYKVYYQQLNTLHTVPPSASLHHYQHQSIIFPQTRALVKNLLPLRDYEVKVAAYTDWGDGVLSRPLDFYVGEAGKVVDDDG